jgi:acyl-coenzyme A synthetase/AMP-(fatty) acid ligase
MVAHSRGQGDSRAARRLNEPRPVRVTVEEGLPAAVGQVGVLQVREEWRVFDRWWTDAPVRRRYFDLVLATGENVAVFEDEEGGGWFRQKA